MLTLLIEGTIIPKARPRVTSRGTFMSQAYHDWMDQTCFNLSSAWRERYQDVELNFPLTLGIFLDGKHSRKGGLDNIGGAVMDTLVKAKILPSDNVNIVNKLIVDFNHNEDLPKYLIFFVENPEEIIKKQLDFNHILVSN